MSSFWYRRIKTSVAKIIFHQWGIQSNMEQGCRIPVRQPMQPDGPVRQPYAIVNSLPVREYELGFWDANNSRKSVTAWMDASKSRDSNIKRTKNLHILSQTDFSQSVCFWKAKVFSLVVPQLRLLDIPIIFLGYQNIWILSEVPTSKSHSILLNIQKIVET